MKIKSIEKFIPFFIGVLGFFFIVGTPPLNVENIVWLSKGDPLFNYVGWELFRGSNWISPIGSNPNYGIDFNSSVVYSDSIPAFAIFFKVFSPFLSRPFQYFGLWLLFCLVMQSLFAYKIAGLFTKSILIKSCAAVIILFSPAMLFRMNVHIALVGHFLLLWAIYLNLQHEKKSLQWILLLLLSLGIHFYLFFMVLALWLANTLDKVIFSKKYDLKSFSIYIGALVALIYIGAWQYGYLVIPLGSSSDYGYGTMQANVLSIFNPIGWSALINDNFFNSPNFESNNYAGLGVIGVIALGSLTLFNKQLRKNFLIRIHRHLFLGISIFVLFMLSISNNIEIGTVNASIPVNEKILFYLNVIRCSGRLMWPLMYLAFFVGLWLLIQGISFRVLLILLLALSALQVFDTSKGWLELHKFFKAAQGSEIPNVLLNNFWKEAPKKYTSIKFVPPQNWPSRWYTFAIYAAKNNLATNSVFLARADFEKIQESKYVTNENLKAGKLDDKTIYIFQEWRDYPLQENPKYNPASDLFARIDGFTLLAPNYKACLICKQVESVYEVKTLAPRVEIGQPIYFKKGGIGSELLLNGWAEPESWGTWSIGNTSRIIIPTEGHAPKSILINAVGLVGPKHPKSIIEISVNGQSVKVYEIDKQRGNVILLPIPLPSKTNKFIVLEFKYLNPSNPKAAGFDSQDERPLTIGIESITLQ